MIKLDNGKYIIGFDNGWSCMNDWSWRLARLPP